MRPIMKRPRHPDFFIVQTSRSSTISIFLKHEPNSNNVSTYRITRDNFRLAAVSTKSFPDSQSFSFENDAALKRVIAILEREKTENVDLLSSENRSCAETMIKDVIPLLKPKNTQAD